MLFSPLIERAIELSAEWHDRTYRKSRWRELPFEVPQSHGPAQIPVMAHLTAVALTVQRAGWDDETVAAAFLHDVLEDRNRHKDHLSEGSLRTLVGDTIAEYVLGVTEPKFGDDGEPLPWRLRKETYLATLSQAPVESMGISLADKLHNAWTMVQGLEAGFDIFTPGDGRKALSAGPGEQLWFFRAVVALSEEASDARLEPLRAELRSQIAHLARLTDQQ